MNDETGQLDFTEHCAMAAREAEKHSTNTNKESPSPIAEQPAKQQALEDLGIHLTLIDRQEIELKAAGWKPMAAHPHSLIWLSPPTQSEPDGLLHPGPGWAWSVMKEQQKDNKQ